MGGSATRTLCGMGVLVLGFGRLIASTTDAAPLRPHSTPYQGGPWHSLGRSAAGQGISGPLNSVPQGLAVDSRGRPHIIWDTREGRDSTQVYYAYFNGRRWSGIGGSRRRGGISHSSRAGSTRARLALDRHDRPHVVWINNEDYRSIEYRHFDGRKWQADRIPWFKSETGQLALAVDRGGRPHIAAIERAEERDSPWPQVVTYRYWDGRKWRTRGGNQTGYIFQVQPGGYLDSICLALDAQDRPHLAWGDSKHIYYTYWDGECWMDRRASNGWRGVDQTDERSFTPSLALDRQDRPHLVWREETAEHGLQVYYRFWEANRWIERDGSATGGGLSAFGRNCFLPQVAVDAQERPHVIWCADPMPEAPGPDERTEVYYKYWNGRRWAEAAGSGHGLGLTNNETRSNWLQLALDPHGRPHVAWGNHARPDLPHVYYVFLASAEKPRVKSRIALKVIESTVHAPGVEQQCRGEYVVKNIGPAYETPSGTIGPSYGVCIYDERGKLLFRHYGGWSPDLKPGATVSLRWNTSSNHLGETSEPAFLIPAPGRYRLEIVLYTGQRIEVLDVSNDSFTVPGPAET